MSNRITKAKRWPRSKSGEILFNTTNEAIIFAHLIFDNKPLVDEILKSLHAARNELAILHAKVDPDLDILMKTAVKAQMFRECLEEITIILVEE